VLENMDETLFSVYKAGRCAFVYSPSPSGESLAHTEATFPGRADAQQEIATISSSLVARLHSRRTGLDKAEHQPHPAHDPGDPAPAIPGSAPPPLGNERQQGNKIHRRLVQSPSAPDRQSSQLRP
jgi:hypothetical protein